MGDDVRVISLREAVELNPKPDRSMLTDDTEVSFVPMASVEAAGGRMDASTIRRYAEVKKGYTHFRDGDVLFAKITPCMENGKMAVAHSLRNGVGLGSTEFHVLRPRKGVDPHYVYHFVSSGRYRSEAAHHMTGAVGQKRVPLAFLEQSLIPLPELSEQQRIVAEIEKQLSRLDEAVAGLTRVKANLKRYKAAILKAAVEGRLVPTEADLAHREGRSYETGTQLLQRIIETRRCQWQGKGKYKEPVAPDTADLAELPEGWAWSSLGRCFRVAVGATPSRKEPSYWNGEIPWVSSGEVQFGRISQTAESITEQGLANASTQLNPAGSVLIGMIGQGRTRGQVALLDIAAANNQNCAAIWVSETPIPQLYVFYWLMGRYEETRGEGSGNNQQALNKSLVETIPLPLPPLAEQHRIVTEVDRLLSIASEAEAEVDTNLKRAQVLRQSILAKAFAG
jgi:type I restriction enzyme S subunit